MSVFEEINSMTAEEILSRIHLPRANDGRSYICPSCGNGEGKDGNGIKPRNSNGRVRWKCHRCSTDFSNFNLAAATLGIDAEREPAEAARRLSELFGIEDKGTSSFPRSKKPTPKPQSRATEPRADTSTLEKKEVVDMEQKKSASTMEPKEPKNYEASGFYKFCRDNVKKFLDERGGSWRGLTAATFEKYKLGVHPEFGVEGHDKRPHVIIPYNDTRFIARAVDGHDRSQHGAFTGLYEPLPIGTDRNLNIVVEGEIDSLSIAQEFDGGVIDVGVAATGGAGNWDKVVPILEKRFGNAESKPRIVVIFDDDRRKELEGKGNTGKINARKLVCALKSAGYPAEAYFLDADQDANYLLQKGADILVSKIFDALDYCGDKLKEQERAMKASAEQERQAAIDKSGVRISSSTEYFARDFFSDIALTKKYAARKTGFENIDSQQVFMPGLYLVGGLPAAGKTTFCWQLLSQLANSGECCAYVSLEMSRYELFAKSMARELFKNERVLSERLDISSVNIRRGAFNDLEELHRQAAAFVRASAVHVIEPSNKGVAEIIEDLKPLIADADKSPVICLDYLQIVTPSKGSKATSAKEKIDDAVLRLKDFQRSTNSTLIVISSFNRENYFQPVSFSSFKESGAIEYSADVVWGLETYGVGEDGNISKSEVIKMSKSRVRTIRLSCLKNRNGGQYDCFFRYYAARDYFEPSREEEEESPTTHER